MNSVLVIGLGRFGRHLAVKCIEEGCDVLAVEMDEERANAAVTMIPNIEIADMRDENVVSSMGVGNFDVCVIAVGDDFQTVLEMLVQLKDFGAKFVVARATREVHEKLLLRNGADQVVYAERDVAERLAVHLSYDHVYDYVKLNDEIGIYEISVPDRWVGRSILELSIRAKHNVSVLAIREGRSLQQALDPNHRFSASERLLVMGEEADVLRLVPN